MLSRKQVLSAPPPIIIVGMHRSGTSMVARLLEQLGLFMGWKKDNNHEARFFGFLNWWLLSQCGGAWDYPEPIQYLLANQDVRQLTGRYICDLMRTRHAISYMGLGAFVRYREIPNIPFHWGWKDPRNTMTLPIWLDLFPEAKVIHILRHGVDVAQSLKVRYQRRLVAQQSAGQTYWRYWFRGKRREGFVNTLRCAALEEGISVWETYVNTAHNYVQRLQDRVIELKYEDILRDPTTNLSLLANFISLPIQANKLHQISESVKSDRAFAFSQDRGLVAFAHQVADRLERYDYGPYDGT